MMDMAAPRVFAMAKLMGMTPPQVQSLVHEVHAGSDLARTYMQMYYVFLLSNQHDAALEMQARALRQQRLYRLEASHAAGLRLLVIMGPGHMQANTPIEFVLEHCRVQAEILYLVPGEALPAALPLHDITFIAVGESEKNAGLLTQLEAELAWWPTPIINRPAAILNGSRDTCYRLLKDIQGVWMPQTQRVRKGDALNMPFPLTLRPIDTHAGEGLQRINCAQELDAYYDCFPSDAYYAATYVDYQSDDGLYRKFRLVLIDSAPYACHLAVSEQWMVHYLSAGMHESVTKRLEEQHFMESFEQDFAVRWREPLQAIARALQLDYVTLDCALAPDGRLLVFEVDSRGLIHAADPVDIYPYKPAVMHKAFEAFERMLLKRAEQDAICKTIARA